MKVSACLNPFQLESGERSPGQAEDYKIKKKKQLFLTRLMKSLNKDLIQLWVEMVAR